MKQDLNVNRVLAKPRKSRLVIPYDGPKGIFRISKHGDHRRKQSASTAAPRYDAAFPKDNIQVKRERPVPGTRYRAGRLLRVDGHLGRHIAVTFACAHCKEGRAATAEMQWQSGKNGVGRASFSALKATSKKKYQTRSCGCLERASFERLCGAYATVVSIPQRREIFESYAQDGALRTAKRFAINKYEANFVWRRHCKYLEKKPRVIRRAIFDACQFSPESTAKRFDLTKHEVLRIQWHWKQLLKGKLRGKDGRATTSLQTNGKARAQFKDYAVLPTFTGFIDTDIVEYMEIALSWASEWEEDTWPQDRYRGELTSREFTDGKSKSQFGWVYLTLRAMGDLEVARCFETLGQQFMELCQTTLRNRIQRRRDFNGKKTEGELKAERPRRKAVKRRRLLPAPLHPPHQIAALIIQNSGSVIRSVK
jgi:hypothetical protein